MEIKVADFIEKITAQDFRQELQLVHPEALQAENLETTIYELVSVFGQIVETNQLAQVTCRTENAGLITEFSLESGIINLPFADIKKVDNFFEDLEDLAEVKVNLIVRDEHVNASKFRIDTLITVAELLNQPEIALQAILSRAQELGQLIEINQAEMEASKAEDVE